jgi:H+/Cl- antiporter ClcA
MPTTKIARLLALVAGSLDFCTGLGLVLLPQQILPLMHVEIPPAEALVYLRFVGAFVGAVGACYLWALVRGGMDRLRSTLELTILFRLSAGAFSATAIGLGWLSLAWASVPVTDFALVGLQLWLVSKLTSHDGHAASSSSA